MLTTPRCIERRIGGRWSFKSIQRSCAEGTVQAGAPKALLSPHKGNRGDSRGYRVLASGHHSGCSHNQDVGVQCKPGKAENYQLIKLC